MDPHQKAEPDLTLPKGRAFWIGIGLMVFSFSAVLFYLVIPFLPVSSDTMVGMLIGGWIVSWGFFFVGVLLAGREGYPYLKQLVQKRFRKR
ncbi:MAG: hypothetical protein ACE5JQ_09710 [Candidatus Methylomirabilales bacterium]